MDAWYTRHLHRQINFQYKVAHWNDKSYNTSLLTYFSCMNTSFLKNNIIAVYTFLGVSEAFQLFNLSETDLVVGSSVLSFGTLVLSPTFILAAAETGG